MQAAMRSDIICLLTSLHSVMHYIDTRRTIDANANKEPLLSNGSGRPTRFPSGPRCFIEACNGRVPLLREEKSEVSKTRFIDQDSFRQGKCKGRW